MITPCALTNHYSYRHCKCTASSEVVASSGYGVKWYNSSSIIQLQANVEFRFHHTLYSEENALLVQNVSKCHLANIINASPSATGVHSQSYC